MRNALIALLILVSARVAAASSLYYEGRLLKADSSAVTSNSVNFTVSITSPSGCVLWTEVQTIDMSSSNGMFALTLGNAGNRTDTTGNAFDVLFSNIGSFVCAGGGTYAPVPNDIRKFAVSLNDGSGTQTFSDEAIAAVPNAMDANRLSGLQAKSFLRVVSGGTAPELTESEAIGLQTLSAGTSTMYVRSSTTVGAPAPPVSTGTGAPTSAVAGSIWFNTATNRLMYYDGSQAVTLAGSNATSGVTSVTAGTGIATTGTSGAITVSLATSGVTAGSFTKLAVDAYGRVVSGSSLVESDIPTLSTAGKVIGSAISSGTIGGSTSFVSTGSIVTTGTVSGSLVSGAAMSTRALSVYSPGGTFATTITSSTLLASNVNFILPSTSGTSGQILTTMGSGTLSWTTANAYVSSQWTTSGTNIWYLSGNVGIGTSTPATALDIQGQAIRVAGTGTTPGELRFGPGPLNGTNHVGFRAPASNPASNIVWTLPAADGTANQVLLTNGAGTLSWATQSAGVVSISSLNGLSAGAQALLTPTTTGTLMSWTSSGTAHTLNLPAASGTTPFGMLTSADWTSFNSKVSGVSGSTLTAGNIWVGSAGNVAASVAMSGDATISNTGVIAISAGSVTANELASGAVSPTAKILPTASGAGYLLMTDIVSGSTIAALGSGCLTGQTIVWGTSGFACAPTHQFSPGYYVISRQSSSAGSGAQIQMQGSGGNNVTLRAPDTIASSFVLTLPSSTGTANQVLSTNGSGNLSWATPSGGGIGTVTSISGGTGTTGNVITSTGTISVNVGTFAGQVLALNASAQIPAVSGALLTSLDASNITAGTLSSARGGTGLTVPIPAGYLLSGSTFGNYALGCASGMTLIFDSYGANCGTRVEGVTAGSGLIGGLISGVGTIAMPTVGTAGSYGSVSFFPWFRVDDYGRVTAAGSFAASAGSSQWVTTGSHISYSAGSVGIGTTAPSARLHVTERIIVGGSGADISSVFVTGGNSTSTGAKNVAVGQSAGTMMAAGFSNVFVGFEAGRSNVNGTGSVGVGDSALLTNVNSFYNTAIGHNALRLATGSINTAVGYQAGSLITSGTRNIVIGFGGNITTGNDNILIGNNLTGTTAGSSNQLNIGDLIYGNTSADRVGIGTSSPQSLLHLEQADDSVELRVVNSTSTTAKYPGMSVRNFKGSTTGAGAFSFFNSGGSSAVPSPMQASEILGVINAWGQHSSGGTADFGPRAAATISFFTDEVFTSATHATSIYFDTTPSGSVIPQQRMRIAGNGNVGIGAPAALNSPAYLLDVQSTGTAAVARFKNVGTTSQPVAIFESGGGANCAILGNSGGTACSSDIRLKKDIHTIESALDKILALDGVRYHFKDENSTDPLHVGFKAQQVKEQIPEVVTTDERGFFRVAYAPIVAVLSQALKEFHAKWIADSETKTAEIRDLRQRLDQAEQKLDQAQKDNVALKARLDSIENAIKQNH